MGSYSCVQGQFCTQLNTEGWVWTPGGDIVCSEALQLILVPADGIWIAGGV